jgi:hypothetical protein
MQNHAQDTTLTSEERLDKFIKAFDNRFPLESRPYCRHIGKDLSWLLFDVAIALYLVGLNGPAVVETYSALQQYCSEKVVSHFRIPDKQKTMKEVVEYLSVPTISRILIELGLWDEQDGEFVEKLNKIRNGIAHKNPKKLSDALLSGRELHTLDIAHMVPRVDPLPFIFGSLELCIKAGMTNPSS